MTRIPPLRSGVDDHGHLGDPAAPEVRRPTLRSSAPGRMRGGVAGRRPLVALASAGLVCLSVVAFTSLYSSARRTAPVLVAARSMPQGHLVAVADLRAVDVAVPADVATIPADQARSVVGHRVAVAVTSGSLVVPSDLDGSTVLASGAAVVGVALKAGEYPPTGLVPGEQVMVVETGGPSGTPLALPMAGVDPGAVGAVPVVTLASRATVYSAQSQQPNSGGPALLVGLSVPVAAAGSIAVAASGGQVSLVLLPASASAATSSALAGGATSPMSPGSGAEASA